jgi:hypothetical protein
MRDWLTSRLFYFSSPTKIILCMFAQQGSWLTSNSSSCFFTESAEESEWVLLCQLWLVYRSWSHLDILRFHRSPCIPSLKWCHLNYLWQVSTKNTGFLRCLWKRWLHSHIHLQQPLCGLWNMKIQHKHNWRGHDVQAKWRIVYIQYAHTHM